MDNNAQIYGTAAPEELTYPAGKETTTLTPAEVDAAAAAQADQEASARAARETKAPVTVADLPAGLSPNDKLALISGGGTIPVIYPPKS